MNENDRRVKRTRKRIEEAFLSLMQKKDYDDITISEVLDRADVGRATFYTHYHDKEELAVSGFLKMLETMGLPDLSVTTPRLLPVKELLFHVQEMETVKKFAFKGSGLSLYLEYGRRFWSKKLAERTLFYKKHKLIGDIPESLFISIAINLFLTVFTWWMRELPHPPAAEMDRWYHNMLFSNRFCHISDDN